MKVLLKILKVIGIIILIIIAVLVAIYFYKIDLDNIGITGFSQGGAGVFNVLTKYEEASYFKVTAVLSPVSEYMTSIATDYTYDSSEVKIPIMIFAGTEGEFELETILPLAELNKQYDKITVPKVMARRVGMIHDQMMYSAGGYVIAWFCWQLMGDMEAAQVFTGESHELLSNSMYQDQRVDLGEKEIVSGATCGTPTKVLVWTTLSLRKISEIFHLVHQNVIK